MNGFNQCSFIGNLGRDPEVRATQSGNKVVNLSLAVSDVWRDKASGERKERTEWVRIVIFNDRIGDVAEKYLRKGSKVFIQGAMQSRKWQDQSGADKYSTEIVLQNFRGELQLLDPKPQESAGDYKAGKDGVNDPAQQGPNGGQAADQNQDFDEEIPFVSWNDIPRKRAVA